MTLFEKKYRDSYFNYHYRPTPLNSLDPRVFTYHDNLNEPTLAQEVRSQILYDIQALNNVENIGTYTRILDYVIVGPILQQNSDKNCPVIILVQISTANLQDVLKERLLNAAKDFSGRLLPGTTHPVDYQITVHKPDLQKYPAVYHPYYDRWLKKPKFLGK
jgi:hypothetical protein